VTFPAPTFAQNAKVGHPSQPYRISKHNIYEGFASFSESVTRFVTKLRKFLFFACTCGPRLYNVLWKHCKRSVIFFRFPNSKNLIFLSRAQVHKHLSNL